MELGTYKFIKQPNQHSSKFEKFKFAVSSFTKSHLRFQARLLLLSTAIVLIYTAGQWSKPEHITAETIVEKEVMEFPIMDRIAKCESQGKHFDKNGQVLVRGNTNKSVDVGKYQINMSVWGAKATELGYNIFTEEGNKAMAMWIYQNKGTEPWYSSKACWNK